MNDFRRLLFDAERYYDRRAEDENRKGIRESLETPIKVAIIDDGVDVKDLECTFIGGRTFCTRDEEHNLNHPYYVSGAGHGTIMAKNIFSICPGAEFYVLRLDDHAHPSEENVRQITPSSAAKASPNCSSDIWRSIRVSNSAIGHPCSHQQKGAHHLHELDHRPAR